MMILTSQSTVKTFAILREFILSGTKCGTGWLCKLMLWSVCILLFGCNSTKFVPENSYLINKITVRADSRNLKSEELKTHIRQKENLRILGVLKFHLGLYNMSSKNKENDWWKRIGEAPVIYDEVLADRSNKQLKIYLKNKGYYNAVVTDTVIFNTKKRKADLNFNIRAHEPYLIHNYNYSISDKLIADAIRNDSINQLLQPGDVFDLDILNTERQRVAKNLKNIGYYKISEDNIRFVADTNLMNHRVNLTIEIDDLSPKTDQLTGGHFQKYKVRDYLIFTDYKVPVFNEAPSAVSVDSLIKSNYRFYFSKKLKYKPGLFQNINRIADSTYYSFENAEKTYRALSRLKQFKLININFQETDAFDDDSIPLIDCRIQLTPLPRHNFSVDIEGTNTSGNLGVAGNFNFQKRNVFGGAEVFDFKIRGARERQQAFTSTSSFDFNTLEFGVETNLTFPEFLSFIKIKKRFSFEIPETKLTAGFNYQRRPDYTRNISNIKFGYNWKSSAYRFHTFNVLDLNYVNLYDFNPEFINSIEDLYIKSSFTDHLITAMNYTWMYNTQSVGKRTDYKYYRYNIESAGNLLSLYPMLVDKQKKTEVTAPDNEIRSYYEVLGLRFAQYLKGDFEYRYGHMINKSSSMTWRAFAGIGVPYGNWDVLPFEKKFFTGGANGIRAWQVRSLGPGSYKAPSDIYPNQSSDIKLEANAEYRFGLFWLMEGALFLDAGNIWAINGRDNREGAVFYFDQFYKQIALGTGLGLRFDFTYFIFRLDLGMKLRDPSLPAGKRLIPGNYKITGDHFNLSFAIGYPF